LSPEGAERSCLRERRPDSDALGERQAAGAKAE
jgi:hypothetical protein